MAILDDKTLGRTLKGISKYKVNPKYQYQMMIVGAAVTNVTIFIRYFSGKIDEAELCKQLGRTNTSLLSGGTMVLAGQVLIPIPVVGALIGGFVGV